MIHVECIPDESLIKALGVPRKNIRHQRNKSEVIKRVLKNKNSKGMVDKDPNSTPPRSLREFRRVVSECNLEILEHHKMKNRLIILCPRLEEWILKAAKEVKINISSEYGLSNDAIKLKREIIPKIEDFKKLLNDIIARRSKMLKKLKSYL